MSLFSVENNLGICLDVQPSKVHGKAVCLVQGGDHEYSVLDLSPDDARDLAGVLIRLANIVDPPKNG